MIRVCNIGFTHGHAPRAQSVLSDISFEIPQGRFRWLMGPSGAGKSTLLKMLYLGLRPTSGEIEILGVDSTHAKRRALARLRQRIGMVHQDFHLLSDLRVRDNVALPLRLQFRPEREVQTEVDAMLRWVGLEGRGDDLPAQLSGGEQQRVAVARAVIHRPALLLADEPTNALDDGHGRRMMDLFQELNAMGTTLVVATHNESFVSRYPARTLWMEKGRLVGDE